MPANLISGVSQSPVHQLDLSAVGSESIMPASLVSGVSQSSMLTSLIRVPLAVNCTVSQDLPVSSLNFITTLQLTPIPLATLFR